MLKIASTYEFNVMGDGTDKSMIIPLRKLKAPDPVQIDAVPMMIVKAQAGASPGGVTATLTGEEVQLIFDVPPPSDKFTSVTLTALFGTERD